MPGPVALYAAAAGAKLLSDLFDISGERARRRRAAARYQREVIAPLESRQSQERFAPYESQGRSMEGAVNQTLGQLAGRGVLSSTFAGPAVATAVAPYQAERRRSLDELSIRRAAAGQELADIEGGAPGYGQAFAGLLGETGGVLAMESGRKNALQMRRTSTMDFLKTAAELYPDLFKNMGPTGMASLAGDFMDQGGNEDFAPPLVGYGDNY